MYITPCTTCSNGCVTVVNCWNNIWPCRQVFTLGNAHSCYWYNQYACRTSWKMSIAAREYIRCFLVHARYTTTGNVHITKCQSKAGGRLDTHRNEAGRWGDGGAKADGPTLGWHAALFTNPSKQIMLFSPSGTVALTGRKRRKNNCQ